MSSNDWAGIGQVVMFGIAVAIVVIVWLLIKNKKILEEKSWVLYALVFLGLYLLLGLLTLLFTSFHIFNIIIGVLAVIVFLIVIAWYFL